MTGQLRARLAAAGSRLAWPRGATVVALAVAMAACSTDDVWRPPVDVGQQTSAIYPAPTNIVADPLPATATPQQAETSNEQWPQAPNDLSGDEYAQPGTSELASAQPGDPFEATYSDPPGTLDAQAAALSPPAADESIGPDPDSEAAPDMVPDAGAEIETSPEADLDTSSEPDASAEPDLGSFGESGVEEDMPSDEMGELVRPADEPVSRPVRIAALPRPMISRPRSDRYDNAYPRLDEPMPERPRTLSSDEAHCRRQLKKLGVVYKDIAPIRDSAACSIDHPVKVSAMGSVQMKPAATLTCRMALTFAQWTRKELVPSARWRYLSGVKAIRQGSSYSCRRIAGSRTQSAHSQGNALDVMAIDLNNGKSIDVRKKSIFSFRERKLLNNVRADGCEYFSTVLGPGYNYDHRNHFHFDLMQRKRGRRACH